MASLENRGTKRQPGPWRVKYRDPSGAPQNSPVFHDKAAALAFQRKVEGALADDTYRDPAAGRVLLADWAGQRIPDWRSKNGPLRPQTRARYQSDYDRLIDPYLGDVELGRLDWVVLDGWVSALVRRPRTAPSSIKKARVVLGRLLADARRAGLIGHDPMEQLSFPKVPKYAGYALTLAELERLAAAVPERDRAAIWVCGLAGLRPGEMLGLQWGDVDLARGRLQVQRTNSEGAGGAHSPDGPTKTAAGMRTVPLHPTVIGALSAHAAILTAAGRSVFGQAWVFPAPGGGADRLTNWRPRVFQPAVMKTGLGAVTYNEATTRRRYSGPTPHDLRRTACTIWANSGATPAEVAAWAGHESTVTVQDFYVRTDADHAGEVFDRITARRSS
jgi:integrase